MIVNIDKSNDVISISFGSGEAEQSDFKELSKLLRKFETQANKQHSIREKIRDR